MHQERLGMMRIPSFRFFHSIKYFPQNIFNFLRLTCSLHCSPHSFSLVSKLLESWKRHETREWAFIFIIASAACRRARAGSKLGQLKKTRQTFDWKIREIDGSYLSLQQFDKFWTWRKHNDRKWKLCESAESFFEKLVKSLWVNLFLASFSVLEPLWGS